MGPGGIIKGSYDPNTLTSEQRNWLYGQFGKGGDAPAGYGGEHVEGDYGNNYSSLGNGQYGLTQSQKTFGAAKQAQQMQIEANQPAIQSYEASKAPLQDRYKNLIDTIKGNQQVAENRQTTTTNNELAKRGISNDSGVYQQALTDSVNPITQQYTGMQKDALANQNVDLSGIENAIAQLKAGNVPNSLNVGAGIANQENQSNQFQQDLALKQALQSFQMNQPSGDRYTTLGEGQTLIDMLNGGVPVYTAPKTYKPSGDSSSNADYYNTSTPPASGGGRFKIVA